MLRTNESRFAFYGFLLLTSVVLALLGRWGLSGLFGTLVLGSAVVVNVFGTLFAPHVPSWPDTRDHVVLCGLSVFVALVLGCITFGWWGLVYGLGAVAGYLLSSSLS